MIRDRDDYNEMKPHTLLGKLQQHEMTDQAAIKAAERVPNAMVPNVDGTSKGVALQAINQINNQAKSRSSKRKKIVEESSSNEDSSDDKNQNIATFIKSFKNIMKGGNKYKKRYDDKYEKRNKKRQCYEYGE